MKGTGDVYSPKVVRASAGSVLRLRFLALEEAEEAGALLRRAGKQIVAATPDGTVRYDEAEYSENSALIIGNEGRGVSEAFKRMADLTVTIPMGEPVESLNAAVAAGILIYHSYRKG